MIRDTGRAGVPLGALAGLAASLVLVAGPDRGTATVEGRQFSFEQVVAGLKHSEASARRNSMRLLAEAGFPEAAAPLAVLLTDPVEEIQLEAIATEVSLLAGSRYPARRRVAGLVDVRRDSAAQAAFWAGPGLSPLPAPVEVVRGMLAAMHDDSAAVRIEATYAFGALAVPDIDRAAAADLKAAFDLLGGQMSDPDARQRMAAAAVAGRLLETCGRRCVPPDPVAFGDLFVAGLNDTDRYVKLNSMWVLGLLRHERAVQALSEQLAYYGRGLEAEAALEALARIAHPSSASTLWLQLASKDAGLRRRAIEGIGRLGDRTRAAELEAAASRESDAATNLAVAFAFQMLRQGSYLDRFIEAAYRADTREQARQYLVELGPSIVDSLVLYLRDPSPEVRALVADVVGRTGSPSAAAALAPLRDDPDRAVSAAATRALARLMR
ncbi:MAG: HEAT repeat domain-containing protein [Vicinamibacterales bacterium]